MNQKKISQLQLELGLIFEQTITEDKLTQEYTGEIDATAAMEQEEACWITRDIVSLEVKKTLLLTSWYFNHLDEDTKENVIRIFHLLIRLGHSIAIPTTNGIQTIDDTSMLRNGLSAFTPIRATDELKQNNTAIVDARMLQAIINKLHEEDQENTHAELLKELSEEDIRNLERLIEPEDTLALKFDSDTRLSIQKSPLLCDKIRHLTLSCLHLNDSEINSIFQNFKRLEHISLKNFMNARQLTQLLTIPGINSLSLKNCRLKPFKITERLLSGLKRLHINKSSLATKSLFSLIKRSPILTHLAIQNCKLDERELLLPPRHLEHLQKLNLDGTTLTEQQKDAIACAAPNIRSLNPGADATQWLAMRINSGQPDGKPALSHISHLCLPGSRLTVHDMSWIVHSLTSLSNLDVSKSSNLDDCLRELSPCSIKTLTHWRVDDTNISSAGLQSLFDISPNLAWLSIQNCLTLHVSANKLQFPGKRGQLMHLDASGSSLTSEQLNSILQAEPNLSFLDLSHCPDINLDKLHLTPGQLPHLQDLSLSGLCITPEGFNALWKAAPNLGCLAMNQCEGSLSTLTGTGHLMYFSMRKSFLTANEVRIILDASPHIAILDISKCKTLGEELINPEEKPLHELTAFLASNTRIDDRQLDNLFRTATNLRAIAIDSVDCIDPEADFSSIQHQPLKLLSPGKIRQQEEQLILNPIATAADLQAPALNSQNLTNTGSREASSNYSSRGEDVSQASSSSSHQAPAPRFLQQEKNPLRSAGTFKINPGLCFTTQSFFEGHPTARVISTTQYHLSAYYWDAQQQIFVLWQPDETSLLPVSPQILPLSGIRKNWQKYDTNSYRAQVELPRLDADTWYQLPATSTQDRLCAFASSVSMHLLELRQDKKTGYHYFRVKTAQNRPVLFSYIIESGLGLDEQFTHNEDCPALQAIISQLRFDASGHLIQNEAWNQSRQTTDNAKIAALKAFCSFKKKSVDDTSGEPYQLFNYMIEHRAGVCRHRGQLFTVLASELGLSAYYVSNDCHVFAIITKEDGSKLTIQLGGARADLIECPMQNKVLDDYIAQDDKIPGTKALCLHVSEPEPGNRYQTWNNNPLQATDAPSLACELIANGQRVDQQWVISEDKQSIEALHQAVVRHHYAAGHTLFSQHLDAVSLTSSRISEGQYHRVPSPVARLISRAENHPDENFTWFINWSGAQIKHKGLDSLISRTRRQLQGRDLPDNLCLVVLIDKESLGKMDKKFQSRPGARSLAARLSVPQRPPLASKPVSDDDILITTPLNWRKSLLGYPVIQGQQHELVPGALLKAASAQTATSITLHNAPLENEAFRGFLTELEETGEFDFNGERHTLPEGSTIQLVKPILSFSATAFDYSSCPAKKTTLAVNPVNYSSFFSGTRLDDGGIHSSPGLLEQFEAHQIFLSASGNLSDIEWYQLIKKSEQNAIRLVLKPTPSATLPDELQGISQAAAKLEPRQPVDIYLSNDIDYALSRVAGDKKNIIPISRDTRFESLFVDVQRDPAGHFTGGETDLLKAIKRGEHVVLKGKFSQELVHKLHSLFIPNPSLCVNGERIFIKGKLSLVSEDDGVFADINCQQIDYHPDEDFNQLCRAARQELRACYQRLKRLGIQPRHSHFQHCPTDRAKQMIWVDRLQSALHLAAGVPRQAPASSSSSTGSSAHTPLQATTEKEILDYLDQYPFAFLISESGAGKSHLMQDALPKYGKKQGRPITVYNLSDIKKWAEHRHDTAILFIDEANISTQDYLMFDNLARGERVIWLNGQRYELSPGQKVVFAGNPYAYGGRKQADLFQRYPIYLQFKAQALRLTLEPMMSLFENKEEALALIEHHYQRALAAGVNITPRNALMICQRVREMKQQAATKAFPESLLLQHALLTELKGLRADKSKIQAVRHDIKNDPLWMASGNELKKQLQERLPLISGNGYHWTPSRIKVAIALLSFIGIREQKINGTLDPNQGINGFLLEGKGLGKGQLITKILQELNVPVVSIALDNPLEARRLLIKATQDKSVVFIPKLNKLLDERLLNDLLSSGCCILAVHDEGELSKALGNRFITMNLKEDSVEDLQAILKEKLGAPQNLISEHIQEFQHAKTWGQQQLLSPLPDGRTLLGKVKEVMKSSPGKA